MGERRRNRRWPRQLEVRVWKQGEEGQGSRAVSTNVSRTGIFVRTQLVLPSGARVRLEIGHSGRSFAVEGVVMRALRSPTHLQAVMPSGMGIRFLTPEQALEELLPAIDFQTEERVPGGVESPTSPAIPIPMGLRASGSGTPSFADEPPAPAPPRPPPSRPPPSAAQATPSASTSRPAATSSGTIGSLQVYPLRFRDAEQFRRIFDRDVKTGGLFISTARPPALDTIIQVEVLVEGQRDAPVALQARVVHRMEPPPGSPPGNLLAGMGVQFLDVGRAIDQLRALLR